MKGSNVVIIILTVLVVELGAYVVYDKLIINDSNEKVNNNEENNSSQDSNSNDNFTLEGTIFEAVNENNFQYIKISKYEDPVHPGDAMYYSVSNEQSKIIPKWNESKTLFTVLNKQSYTEASFSGIGIPDYQIDIVYKVNNEDKNISVQPEMVFGTGIENDYSVTATDEVKTEI